MQKKLIRIDSVFIRILPLLILAGCEFKTKPITVQLLTLDGAPIAGGIFEYHASGERLRNTGLSPGMPLPYPRWLRETLAKGSVITNSTGKAVVPELKPKTQESFRNPVFSLSFEKVLTGCSQNPHLAYGSILTRNDAFPDPSDATAKEFWSYDVYSKFNSAYSQMTCQFSAEGAGSIKNFPSTITCRAALTAADLKEIQSRIDTACQTPPSEADLALQEAIKYRIDLEELQKILANKPNLNSLATGSLPLNHILSSSWVSNSAEGAGLLMNAGADPTLKDFQLSNALQAATRSRPPAMQWVSRLVHQGLDINSKNHKGTTLLMNIALNGDADDLNEFIKLSENTPGQKLNINQKNNYGETALQLAENTILFEKDGRSEPKEQWLQIIKILKEAGAN